MKLLFTVAIHILVVQKHNLSESAIQLVVEILALSREEAIALLVTYGGDSEAVISNAFM
jgi:NACalpha-BTF3-like transcription factor